MVKNILESFGVVDCELRLVVDELKEEFSGNGFATSEVFETIIGIGDSA